MRTLITILARKGSKGLPNKHLLPFNGKPLIEWTIWNAKDYAKGKDADIVVATDSMETFNLAGDLGVCAIPRNPKYATDEAGKVDAIRDVWKQREGELWIKGNELILSNPIYDCVIDLDVTNPCRTVKAKRIHISTKFNILKIMECIFLVLMELLGIS
jgi:N-acylneuraminate cytidylyltransferase/CMP-N,N'-diacetyllegionaminic acid synthase